MRKLFCYGKKDYCDKETCTGECEFHDGSGCEYRKTETRADRIRAMSDQELAAYWADTHDNFCQNKPECGEALNRDELIPEEWCVACALAWLRQPVEGTKPATMATDEKQESGLLED